MWETSSESVGLPDQSLASCSPRDTSLPRPPMLICLILCIALVDCSSVDDPVAFSNDATILLPASFEGLVLKEGVAIASSAFIESAYGVSEGAATFEYGDEEIQGFTISFGSLLEAQRRHRRAGQRIFGHSSIPRELGEDTLRGYRTRFFFENGVANLFFHTDSHTVFFRMDRHEESQTVVFGRARKFANQVLETNGLLDTYPPLLLDLAELVFLPAKFSLTEVEPSPFEKIKLDQNLSVILTFEYDVSADVSTRAWGYVEDLDRLYTDPYPSEKAARTNASEIHMRLGRGEIKINVPVDLSKAKEGDRIRVDVSFTVESQGGLSSSLMGGLVRYSVTF